MEDVKVLAGFFVAVLAVSVIAANGLRPDDDGGGGPARLELELASALQPFDECGDALAYFTDSAAEQAARPPAVQEQFAGMERARAEFDTGSAMAAEEAAQPTAPAPAADQAAGSDAFSGTNVQEAGVDEPDVVKTDGRRIVAVAGSRLHVIDASGGAARSLGTLDLPGEWGGELLLDGDRALVVSTVWGAPVPLPAPRGPASFQPSGGGQTVLTLVDLSDDAAPAVASTLTMEGEYVSARMVGGVARVVLRSHPSGPVPEALMMDEAPGAGVSAPAGGSGEEPVVGSRTVPAEPIEPAEPEPTIDDWVPHYRLEDGTGVTEDRLVDCDAIYRPVEPAGTGMVSVLSVDLAGGLQPDAAASVVADAQTVYASPETLYVAFTGWEQETTTEIHAFDITDPAAAVYTASGSVPGRLLNQWALSEHAGHLRVATTEGESFGRPMPVEPEPGLDAPEPGAPDVAPAPTSHSAVTVLARRGEELVAVGRVEGLGPDERIYSVRFMGDVGYVVTFRETDPLYTLDLSDPANPRVLGELKILGYSAYLHPVGDGLLLGVGQDADEQGMVRGTQLSLFDVSDLANPTRAHQATIPGASSAVEHDHRAFLHWPATGAVVLPLEIWSPDGETFVGAAAFSVDEASGFAELGRLSHAGHVADPSQGAIRRALVIGDTLYTLSEAGLQAASLSTLAEQAWVGF